MAVFEVALPITVSMRPEAVVVTIQDALLLLSAVVTVIVTVPAVTALTSPLAETVAFEVSELDQVNLCSVAFAGVTLAESCSVLKFVIVVLALFNVTPVTR